jgi:uroporphyrinogen decarboxylase
MTVENAKSDIDAELEEIRELLKYGGYLPHIDHHVSDDVRWDNFKYYRQKLNEIIDSV